MPLTSIALTPEESRLWEGHLLGLYIGYITNDRKDATTGHWFRVLETTDCPMRYPTKVAVDSDLLGNVLSVWHLALKKDAKRKGWTDNEKLSAYVSEDVTGLFQKLLTAKTNQSTMIDLTTITPEELAALKKQIADREAILKKVSETQHSLEAAAKKAGYESLDLALSDLGYVKATAKPTKGRKPAASGTRKPRTTVTDELRQKVLDLLDIPMTAEAIAEQCGISAQTVASIKKKAGLTKSRKAAAPAAS